MKCLSIRVIHYNANHVMSGGSVIITPSFAMSCDRYVQTGKAGNRGRISRIAALLSDPDSTGLPYNQRRWTPLLHFVVYRPTGEDVG
jgi:hypothetical protein